jgi:hypothetical protein
MSSRRLHKRFVPGAPLTATARLHRAIVCCSVINEDSITVWSRVLLTTGEIVTVDLVGRADQTQASYLVVQSRPAVIDGEALYEVDLERVAPASSSWPGPDDAARAERAVQ